jgi:hypothetical protein
MNAPAWLPEAAAEHPVECAALDRLTAALQALPKGAPVGEFVELYEQMLQARDALYEAWISRQMDEPA